MKYLYPFLLFAVLSAAAFATETSDKFAQYLPNFAAEDGKVRESAQQDWQKAVLGEPANRAEAVKLMLDQLAKDNPVETSLWLLRQTGYAAGSEAVPTLVKYLGNSEKRLADEAARALGRIPTAEASAALKAADTKLTNDVIIERNHDRNILNKNSKETALPQALFAADGKTVADWMKKYDSLSDYEKSVTLAILTAKQDKQYLPQALAALKSQDGELLKAGLLAVETFGGEKEVPALLEQAFSGNDKGLATQILSRKGGKEIDAALVAALKAEKDNGRYEALADILSRRWNTSIRPILLEKAKQADYPNRLRLLQIAEGISGKDNVGEFVDVWEAIADRGQKDNAEQIISRLCGGDSAPVTAKRTAANESAMWSLLARVGDDKSLADIRKAVFEEKPGTDKFAAVFNALRNYPDGRVADDLFKVAQSGDFPENDRVNALRSFIRVISLPNDRIRIPINDKQQVEKLAKAFDLAARVDEKRYVIERVGQIRTVESLTFVLKHFDDAELQDRVIRSVLDLAHHTDLRRRDKEAFTAALDKVLATTKHQDLLERAKRYKDNF